MHREMELDNVQDSLAKLTQQQQRELLHKLLQQRLRDESCFPLSAGQQGLWYAYRRDPTFTPFNVFLPTRVRSPLDTSSLKQAIEYLVERHACLRTTFTDKNAQLRQIVHPRLAPEFIVEDASSWEPGRLDQRVLSETQRPFDLEHGPLLRLRLFRLTDDDWVILAATHHIVVDFWSLILLLRELQIAYPSFAQGVKPSLPPPNGNYAQFVRHQQSLLDGPRRQILSQSWRQAVSGATTVIELPTDFARPANFSGQAEVTALEFPESIVSRITQFAASQHATPFAVVHSAVQVLLSRYSGQKSFLIGSPFSGRGHEKFEQTVGFFVNMLPLRADLEDDPSFVTLVNRFGTTLLHALENQDYPFAQIVRDKAPTRDPSRSPMFQVSCTFEKSQDREEAGRAGFLFPNPREVRIFGGLRQESYYVPQRTCHYDVEFIFELTETALRGMIVYARDLFVPQSIRILAENFQKLLSNLLDQPRIAVSQVPWLQNLSAPVQPHPPTLPSATDSLVHSMIDEASRSAGSRVALRDGEFVLTYYQLLNESGKIAQQLLTLGVAGDDLVPVCGRRGAETLVGILGVLASGAAFIPIDTEQPAIGALDLQSDAHPKAIVVQHVDDGYCCSLSSPLVNMDLSQFSTAEDSSTSSKSSHEMLAAAPSSGRFGERNFRGLASHVKPSNLAYVIYTSGSSGAPKGVMIEHRAICNTLHWRIRDVPLASDDRLLLLLSHQFDACVGIALTGLTQGAQLVWAEEGARHDLEELIDQLIRDQITVLPAVPSIIRMLVNHPRFKQCTSVRQIWTGGEAMPADLPGLVRKNTSAKLWNFYGPTETAVEATACLVENHDPRRSVPIGRAIANTTVTVLDDDLRSVPDTVAGQLAISGAGLARGYLRQPELTAQKFVSNPLDTQGGSRMYLTGDRCRKLVDGNIEFLGRLDHQVKLRGYRIELGEIESMLQTHPTVRAAAAKLCNPDSPSAQLIAFVTLRDSVSSKSTSANDGGRSSRSSNAPLPSASTSTSQQLRSFLAERFPSYKIPSAIYVLDELPMTASGKVDRQRLPELNLNATGEESLVQASTPLESYLAEKWKSALGLVRIGVNQNFFDLGGSSLQAAILTSELTEQLGVHVPTALLFDLADISQVAQRLVQLYESEMAERFGLESTTAYGARLPAATDRRSTSIRSRDQFHPLLSPLKISGSRSTIFMVHPPGGIVVCYRELAKYLPSDLPLVGIRSRGLHGSERLPGTIEEMAQEYVEAIRTLQPKGSYVLGGWSLGGIVAFEMAQQLIKQGESVQRLLLLDTTIAKGSTDLVPASEQVNVGLEYGIDMTLNELSQLDAAEQLPFLWQHAKNLGVLESETPEAVVKQVLDDLRSLFHHHLALASEYRIARYSGSISLFRPRDIPFAIEVTEDRGWRKIAQSVEVQFVPGHHHSMVQPPQVAELAERISQSLLRS